MSLTREEELIPPAARPHRRSVAANVLWNFLGNGAPLLVALVSIPPLIRGLGTERFGALTIAWVVMGYFGLFDLGLGRATTRAVAESMERGERDRLPPLIATSTIAHAALGLLGGVVLAALTPWLVGSVLTMPDALRSEVNMAFYVLAASVPIIVVTSAPRGVLEALRRFDLVNMIKTPASIATYLIPLIVLRWTPDLATIVLAIAVVRVAVMTAYAVLSLREVPMGRHGLRIDMSFAKGLFGYGWWLVIPSLLAPAIASLDRFIIAAVVSLSAVAWYATPYEVVTRLWIVSGSVLAVLFPAFSAIGAARSEELQALSYRSARYLTVISLGPVIVMVAFADLLLQLWLGHTFAMQSATAARILAIGMLINVVAQVPFTTLQSVGFAKPVAATLLTVLPLYGLAAYFAAQQWGINGVAAAWTGRVAVEGLFMFVQEYRLLYRRSSALRPGTGKAAIAIVAVAATLAIAWLADDWEVAVRVAVVGSTTLAFLAWAWHFWFDTTDRDSVLRRLRWNRVEK